MQKIVLALLVLSTNKEHSERSSTYTNCSDVLFHQLLFKNPQIIRLYSQVNVMLFLWLIECHTMKLYSKWVSYVHPLPLHSINGFSTKGWPLCL